MSSRKAASSSKNSQKKKVEKEVETGPLLMVIKAEVPGEEFHALTQKNKVGKRVREDDFSESDVQISQRTLVVIKMKKFDLVLGSKNDGLDFRQGKFKSVLVHEQDNTEVVERKGGTVLSCKFSPSKNGNSCAVEVVIGVLSSQVGGLFRIWFTFDERESCYSDVIKVVSKKSQLEKEEKPKRVRTTQVATREAVLELIDEVRDERRRNEVMMERILVQNKMIQDKIEGKNGLSIFAQEGDETPEFFGQEGVVDSFRRSLQAMARLDASEQQNAMKHLSECMTQNEMDVFCQLSNGLVGPRETRMPTTRDLKMSGCSSLRNSMDFGLFDSNARAKLELSGLDNLW